MKKGFTLIELLAVIIILAVVAIIATPIVLNVVNDAKESAAKSQAYLILDGARNYYAESIFDNNKKNKIDNLGNIYDDIEMSSKKPQDGKLYVNSKGLTAMAVVINNKCYKKEFGGNLHIIDEADCDLGYTGSDVTSPTIEITVLGNPFNENDWANADFYVSINVIDDGSGPYSYEWCDGFSECEPIALVEETSGNVLISTESDSNIVCVIGYDQAGNMSDKTCNEPYKLDKTNPQFEGINDLVVNKNDSVNLESGVTATDNLSGIDGTYSYNPTSVNTFVAGATDITYSASDMAGNETVITRKVIVDAIAPTVEFTALGDKINASGWAKEDFYVEASLIDRSGLGIKSAKWCSTTNNTCTPIADMVGDSMTPLISTESNNNRICIIATDNNDKTSEVICSDSYKLDKTDPIVGTIVVVNGTLGSNNWYTSNVILARSIGSDALSGHSSTNLDITTITTNTAGTTVTLTTSDVAGNTSTTTRLIKLDKNSPTITSIAGDIRVGQGENHVVSDYFNATYSISGGSVNCNPTNTSSLSTGSRTLSCTATGGNGLTASSSKTIMVEYTDNSGANRPELYDNMIPITWNGTNWIYADVTQTWYDYDSKWWANAFVLKEGVTKNVGDIISASERALMLVWIPRYKYTIFNGNNGSVNPQQINIVFESGTNSTGTVTCTNGVSGSGTSSEVCSIITNGVSTYTHPAFTFGTKDLTGFWVGKFENSTPDATCNTNQNVVSCDKELPVTIGADVRSWRSATISNFFNSILNMSDYYNMNVNSHMMKSMEWGAVGYLAHSKYGRCTSGTCTQIAKNDSSDFYTGRGQGVVPPTSSCKAAGTYRYLDEQGKLSSTTGNIYGVYDMVGGAFEYLMANMVSSSNQFQISDTAFSNTPASRYYTSYTYGTSEFDQRRGRLGDGTKEPLTTYGIERGGWYNSYSKFFQSDKPWIHVGGSSSYETSASLFAYFYSGGYAEYSRGSRTVIVAE